MSSYTTSEATISPNALFLQQIVASDSTFFNLSCPVASSLQLIEQRELLQTATSDRELGSHWASLNAVPGALGLLRQAAPADLAAFTNLKDAAGLAGRMSTESLAASKARIGAALDTTIDRLRADERHITVAALNTALDKLGYTIPRVRVGDGVTGLAAYKEGHVIAAAVYDGGRAEIDTAGLSGDSCVVPLRALDAALVQLGVQLRIERQVQHGDPDGGTLIQRAAAAHSADLAAGVIASAGEATSRSSTTRPATRQRRNRGPLIVGGTT